MSWRSTRRVLGARCALLLVATLTACGSAAPTSYTPPLMGVQRSGLSTMVTPASSSILTGTSQTFEWTDTGADRYALWVGSTPGAWDVWARSTLGTATSVTVTGLPADGRALYVRLWDQIGGVWTYQDQTYWAYSLMTPVMTSPLGSVLLGGSQEFAWAGIADEYALWVGNSPGSWDVWARSSLGTSTAVTVTNLPVDGRPLYVRLSFRIGAKWFSTDATYWAAWIPDPFIESPPNGLTFADGSQDFTWTPGADEYALWIGTALGTWDVWARSSLGAGTTATVTDLPTNGQPLYVRFWYRFGNTWRWTDSEYQAAWLPRPNLDPPGGTTFSDSTQTFHWTPGAEEYGLWVGTTPGSWDVLARSSLGTATTATATDLPTDGSPLYVRLWYRYGTTWSYLDESYTSVTFGRARLLSPTPGVPLRGPRTTFAWTSGAEEYALWIGTARGTWNVWARSTLGAATTAEVTGISATSAPLYARLWYRYGSSWRYDDYEFIGSHLIGGTVGGLTGHGLVLASSGQPDLPVFDGATSFAFEGRAAVGSVYSVTVKTQPAGQTCTVRNGTGVVQTTDVVVAVRCSAAPWSMAATGHSHVVALETDGTLWAWGNNSSGQLGDGTTLSRSSPVLIGSGYASVTARLSHTLAVKSDSTLWAWGSNESGQLGDGTTTDRSVPVQVGSGFASVATGYRHTLAVKTDGTLWAWGSNASGQLGDGTATARLAPMQIGTGFVAASAGSSHSVALKADGTLWAWGSDYYGQLGLPSTSGTPTPCVVGSGYAAVAAGEHHTLAVRTDGSLWGWGRNNVGLVGNDTTIDQDMPVQIGTGFSSASANFQHSMAVKADGTLWAWGYNYFGWLGDGTTTQRNAPVQVGTDFAMASAGSYFSAAVKTDGTLWTFGDGNFGQLGVGRTLEVASPAWIGANVASVAVGAAHVARVMRDGTLWVSGYNLSGQVGDGTNVQRNVPVLVASGMTVVATGRMHTAALAQDGTLWAWGQNRYGQVGNGATTDQLTPVQIGSGFSSLSSSGDHTVALKTDGTLWAWGYNLHGQIGNGTTADQLIPMQIGTGFIAAAAGGEHTLALKADGTLWAWGWNVAGQVGNGVTADQLTPMQVGAGFSAIGAGYMHSLAVKPDGALFSWGQNQYGQLGTGTVIISQLTPLQVATDFVSVAAGAWHSLGMKVDGTLWAWGRNDYGQLGDGMKLDQHMPTPVAFDVEIGSVHAGGLSSVALMPEGTLLGWGADNYGQLGDSGGRWTVPVRVE